MRTRRKVETTDTRSAFEVVFESGLSTSGMCTIRHMRQLVLADEEWVPGSHDVAIICDEDLPYGTVGQPGRVTVTDGHVLVGSDNWKVYPESRRLLAFGGD
jgi:hypothetical protein